MMSSWSCSWRRYTVKLETLLKSKQQFNDETVKWSLYKMRKISFDATGSDRNTDRLVSANKTLAQ